MTRRDRHLLFGLAAPHARARRADARRRPQRRPARAAGAAVRAAAARRPLRRRGAASRGSPRRSSRPAAGRAAPLPTTARRSPLAVPRGGRLIAASLAVRPPPARAAPHRLARSGALGGSEPRLRPDPKEGRHVARRIDPRRRALRARGGAPRHIRVRPRRQPELRVARARRHAGDPRLHRRRCSTATTASRSINHGSQHGHDRRLQQGAVHPHERPAARSRSTCARRRTTSTRTATTARRCRPPPTRRPPPQWKVVARDGRYEFHDHRMHWMAKNVPPQVTDKSKRTKIVDWKRARCTRGGATARSTATLFWRGSSGGRAGRRVRRARR